ncbi:hypothetical protein DBR23_13875 [Acidovorax sp. HMWF018]|nr:hypothetical protein DBR23_13875 [Acidovorax sp. HMWF018]
MERLAEGVERVGQGYRNKDGFTSDALGKAQTQGIWTRTAIIDYLKQAGLEEQIATKLSEQFIDANGNVPYEANDVQKRWAGKFGTLSEALGKMAEYYRYTDEGQADASQMLDFEKRRRGTPQLQGQGASPSANSGARPGINAAANGGSSGAPGATYVSNITIDGQPTTVRFADAESQGKGEDLLRRLARAKSTAVR